MDLVLKSPIEMDFFVFVKISIPDGYIIEIFKWDFILMNFMGFSSTISKVSEIVIVKNYTNEILEFKTIPIWIIYKNMLGILGSPVHLLKMGHYNLHSPFH